MVIWLCFESETKNTNVSFIAEKLDLEYFAVYTSNVVFSGVFSMLPSYDSTRSWVSELNGTASDQLLLACHIMPLIKILL